MLRGAFTAPKLPHTQGLLEERRGAPETQGLASFLRHDTQPSALHKGQVLRGGLQRRKGLLTLFPHRVPRAAAMLCALQQPPRGLWAPILSAPFSQSTLPLRVLTWLLLLYCALVLAET